MITAARLFALLACAGMSASAQVVRIDNPGDGVLQVERQEEQGGTPLLEFQVHEADGRVIFRDLADGVVRLGPGATLLVQMPGNPAAVAGTSRRVARFRLSSPVGVRILAVDYWVREPEPGQAAALPGLAPDLEGKDSLDGLVDAPALPEPRAGAGSESK